MLDNIPQQKQVLQDIYNILSQIAVDVQPPQNVSINTSNNIHTIQNFGYNLNPKHYGSYEYAISLKIGVDYNIKNLTATVLTAHLGNIFPKIIREVDENTNKTTIDGIECKFYNNGICASPINKKETKCKNIPSEWCYFKQLAQAKEEIAFLQNTINHFAEKLGIEKPNYTTQKDFSEFMSKVENSERITAKEFELLSQLKEELEEIKKEFQIEYLQDNTTGKRTYRSLTLLDVEQERDELLKFKEMQGKELLKLREQLQTLDDETITVQLTQAEFESLKAKAQELEIYQDREPTIFNTISNLQLQVKTWIEQLQKYKQALDEIKNYQQRNCETCVFANAQKCNINCQVFVILDIINKAKEERK